MDVQALIERGDRSGLRDVVRSLDLPLMFKTLEHIEAHPEEHDQDVWVCGTRMCFAGHGAVIAGAEFVKAPWTGEAVSGEIEGKQYQAIHISNFAQQAMGLSSGEASLLFYGQNDVEDLRRYVETLAEKGHLHDFGVEYNSGGWSEWYGRPQEA